MSKPKKSDPKEAEKGVAPLGPVSPEEQEEALRYWTEKRMREALPIPLPTPPEPKEETEEKAPQRQDD
jgi:hypothetical protein